MPLSKRPGARRKQLANIRPIDPKTRPAKPNLKHGARAMPEPKRQAAIEMQLCDALPVRSDDGSAPAHDMVTVRLLAITLCRIETCTAYVNKHGQFTSGGKVREAAVYEERLTVRASNLADKLGLSPTSRVRMGLQLAQAQDLAQLLSGAGDDATSDTSVTTSDDDPITDAEVVEDG